jgi:DNA-binding GntR family transcriptional regulator
VTAADAVAGVAGAGVAGAGVAGAAVAYEHLRSAIVESRYPPGHRLVEQHLAAELGLSRTPVREALRMLQAEGLVVSERNRGAMVRPLSPTEVVDLYGLRIRLESYAVELGAERSTETELGALVDAADGFRAVVRAPDVDSVEGVRRIHEANRVFHDAVLEAARHRRLTAMLARTVDIPLVFQAFRSFGPAELERSDTFHHLIAEAMCRRDGQRAAALMAEHIAQGRDAVLDAIEDRPSHDRRPHQPTGPSHLRRGSAR